MSDVSSMSKEERRALAIAKLSKAFGGKGGRPARGGEDEEDFLREVLETMDVGKIHRMVKERLDEIEGGSGEDKALARRFEKLRGEYELEEAGKAAGKKMEDALRRLHQGKYDSAVTNSGYWEDRVRFRHGLGVAGNGGAVGVGCGAPASRRTSFSGEELERQAALLGKKGFMVAPGIDWGADVSLPRLVGAMQELKSKGWPACFVFAYQEPWTLIERVFDAASPIFGANDIAIEPSVFAWHLDPPAGDQSAAGNNGFHLPHRDFSHTETFAPDGSLSTLSVWIPLTDARIDNGCMYALPKEFDAEHDMPEKATHLRAAVDKGDGGVEIRFPLQAARPLVGPAGSLMAWHGNTIHWGGRCASDAPFPRASIAFTLCRRSAVKALDGNMPVSREELRGLDLKKRLGMVAHSIIMHKRWYAINEGMVPPDFFQGSDM